jgi:GNAT superfamily N-acetyltransferase
MRYIIERFKGDRTLLAAIHDTEPEFYVGGLPGDDNEFWVARERDSGRAVGFCSARYIPEMKVAELTRAAVMRGARGGHLQRRMIKARVNWARKMGAEAMITYVSLRNYPSLISLLREGFLAVRNVPRGWKGYHLLYKSLRADGRQSKLLQRALRRMT